MIHFYIAQVGIGQILEGLQGVIHAHRTGFHRLE